MEDFDFLINELHELFKSRKQTLIFHLGSTHWTCDLCVLEETWEEKVEIMGEIALKYTGKSDPSRVTFDYLTCYQLEDPPDMQVGIQAHFRNYISLSSLNWLWGLNYLSINRSDGIRGLLNAIHLLDRCMGILEYDIWQITEVEKKVESSNGAKAKASRYAQLKAEVIRLLYMKMPEGGWRKKTIALEAIYKDLIMFVEKNGLSLFSDKQNKKKDVATLYSQIPRLIEDWSRDDAVVKAVIDVVVIRVKKSAL